MFKNKNIKSNQNCTVLLQSQNAQPKRISVTEAPKLDLSNMIPGRDIRVRAGEPFSIDIPILGAPTPTVTWKKDGKDLPESPRVRSVSS